MPRSLLDGVDLAALRGLDDAAPDALAVGLVDAGLLQFDPDDPEWEDRDRVVASGDTVVRALGRRFTAAGADPDLAVSRADTGGAALALAFGAAIAGAMDGGAWRAWCVLDDEACEDGRVWEVARAAAAAPASGLAALVAGTGSAGLWRACGWSVHEAPAADLVWVLGALDQLVVATPSVLLVAGDE